MAKYRLTIELLSDLCVSDGGVYNSLIDIDCCYDTMGFPYIPAKRIKGCLRECALELNDWGKKIDICRIFGEGGRSEKGLSEKRARLRIGNAYLQNYSVMRKEVEDHDGHILYHSQNILNRFTSFRTQTAISQETGVADPHSLRTMRVINKGLVFIADVNMPADDYENVKSCCAVFNHLGISRTRGFGEINAIISQVEDTPSDGIDEIPSHADLTLHADFISYEITLEEPLICKSVAGGEARTLDYIEGSKVLGLILEQLKNRDITQEQIDEFLNEGILHCSNAYIGFDGHRFTEVPAYIYSIKNNKEDYVDRRIHRQNEEGIQLSRMKHCYVLRRGTDLLTMDVNVEDRYHHRRAEDKSIGRAVSTNDGSDFYQMSSIMSGQKFYGNIYGSEKQIETVYTCLTEKEIAFLGYGRSAEYGKIQIRIIDSGITRGTLNQGKIVSDPMNETGSDISGGILNRGGTVSDHINRTVGEGYERLRHDAAAPFIGTNLVVKLESPTIIYNQKAMYSVDREDLFTEILSGLEIDDTDIISHEEYINYTTTGGFNVTWGRRKPVVPAFDKGTAVCLKTLKKVTAPSTLFIGERCIEGFGEISITLAGEYSEDMRKDENGVQSEPAEISHADRLNDKNGNTQEAVDQFETDYNDYLKKAVERVRNGSIISCGSIPGLKSLSDFTAPAAGGEPASGRKGGETEIIRGSLGDKLAEKMFLTYLGAKACEQAQDDFKAKPEKYRPTISNLLTGINDYQQIEDVERMVTFRYGKKSEKKEEKLTYAQEILEKVKGKPDLLKKKFCTDYNISGWDWTEEEAKRFMMYYLRELLVAIKLRIRSVKDDEREE